MKATKYSIMYISTLLWQFSVKVNKGNKLKMKQYTLTLKLSAQKHTSLTKCAMFEVMYKIITDKAFSTSAHYKTEYVTKPLANKV